MRRWTISCNYFLQLFLLNTFTLPSQWKAAKIKPIPKVPHPQTCADYRPISITPVLSRVLERIVVSTFLYPSLYLPAYPLDFTDQYAFRPTGSTTFALINLLNTVTNMLVSNKFVRIIAVDFSKAFDTVRHSTLAEKLAKLQIPDTIYNWLLGFLQNRVHCTDFDGEKSQLESITASIIQGSAVGPFAYDVVASDLHPIVPGNCINKFADDTYVMSLKLTQP